jgi:hypothetical protein
MPPGGEACNGEDDDCDGVADEELGGFTCGIGACATTVPACVAGVVSACVPWTPTATTDGCNGVDDDCDGAIDENCAACIKVAPDGDDAAAAASNGATPFRNVQPAIDFANTHRSISTRVCVASGTACGATASFPGPTGVPLTMRNGISVLGKFESTGWTPCSNSVTTLTPQTGDGVLFPAGIVDTTVLDGFTIDRFASPTTSGVTVDGARGALLSNLTIVNAPAVDTSYGVNVVNGGDATVFRSRIDGTGRLSVAGVRSSGARVSLLDNCSRFSSTGQCIDGQCPIRARAGATFRPSYGVLLEDSPGSRIERSAVCSASSYEASVATPPAAIRVKGSSTGLLMRANSIAGSISVQNDAQNFGILLEDCAGAKPWIVDNAAIEISTFGTDALPAAIRAAGDCHPVIDSNPGLRVSSVGPIHSRVVECGASGGIASRCVVANNEILTGYVSATQARGVGVRCESGSCAKISRNTILGHYGITSVTRTPRLRSHGIELFESGAFVERNTIRLTCVQTGIGILAEDSWSRIQNNIVTAIAPPDDGRPCEINLLGLSARPLLVRVGPRGNDPDVHSNLFDVGINSSSSNWNSLSDEGHAGIELQSSLTSPTVTRAGVFRNNEVRGGVIGYLQSATIVERALAGGPPGVDPRILEYNFLSTFGDPGEATLYFDEGATAIGSIEGVNALTDTTAAGNVEDRCRTLSGASPCIDAGTPVGAPLWDFDGRPRDAAPDVGPYELD